MSHAVSIGVPAHGKRMANATPAVAITLVLGKELIRSAID
jgi:hypothetical protein